MLIINNNVLEFGRDPHAVISWHLDSSLYVILINRLKGWVAIFVAKSPLFLFGL